MAWGVATALAAALAWPLVAGTPDEHVVARVQTRAGPIEITAGRLRAYAEGKDAAPRKLLQDLVDFELLAAEAAARYGDRPGEGARVAAAQVMVRKLLTEDFEAEVTAENIPADVVRQGYERNRGHFVHPDLRAASHILVHQQSKRPEDPALDAEARALAARIVAELKADPPADDAAFRARAKRYEAAAEALGLNVRVEDLGLFAQEGRYVKAFTDAAFAAPVGEVAEPAPSEFGWHVIRVREARPAQERKLAEVEDEIRERMLPNYRKYQFRTLVNELAREHDAAYDPAPLKNLETAPAE